MLYLKENFSLGEIKYSLNLKEAVKDRFFFQFLSCCFDQHLSKSVQQIVKSEFQIPMEFLQLVDNRKTLLIITTIKSGKTLVSDRASTLHLKDRYHNVSV